VREEVGERFGGLGERTRLGVGHGVVDLGGDARANPSDVLAVEETAGLQ
jgi:hypothetical protein